MVSNTEEVTDVSPSLCINQTTAKKTSARKSLCLFTNIFDVKKKTEKRHVESENQNAYPLKLEIAYGTIK